MANHKERWKLLGMSLGRARGKLVRSLLLKLAKESKQDLCFRCGQPIESPSELTIEHKLPWEGISASRYFDLDNVAFSHAKCNRPHRKYVRRKLGPENAAWCSGCKKFLACDLFFVKTRRWNGLDTYCKVCRANSDIRKNHAKILER